MEYLNLGDFIFGETSVHGEVGRPHGIAESFLQALYLKIKL